MFGFISTPASYPVVKKNILVQADGKCYTEPTSLAIRINGRTKNFVKLNFRGKEKKIKIRVINYNGTETEAIWIKENKVWVVATMLHF